MTFVRVHKFISSIGLVFLFIFFLQPLNIFPQNIQIIETYEALEKGEKYIKERTEEKRDIINKWDRNGKIILWSTILVGIFGIFIGILQTGDTKWHKAVTFCFGTTISIIMVINNAAFDADHRVYQEYVHEGRKLLGKIDSLFEIEKAQLNISRRNPKASIRKYSDLLSEAGGYDDKLNSLIDNFYSERKSKKYSEQSNFVAFANAKSDRHPKWINNPPKNKRFSYFIGIGQDTELEEARSLGRQNATEQAVKYFEHDVQKTGLPIGEFLTNLIIETAELEDTYKEYDTSREKYKYFVLLRVSINRIRDKIELKKYTYIPYGKPCLCEEKLCKENYPPIECKIIFDYCLINEEEFPFSKECLINTPK